jgi:tetratricopeptide (TPR) repeat protein
MAPEQWRGEAVDARADQFSFCLVLHEALLGAPAFEGTTSNERCRNVLEGRRAPRSEKEDVPRWVLSTLERGLAVDRTSRFPSMEALLSALDVPRARPGRRIAAALAATAAVAGLALVGAVSRAPSVCAQPEKRVRAVWNEVPKDQVREALLRASPHDGAALSRTVLAALDAYGRAWAEARREACTSLASSKTETASVSQLACLDRGLQDLQAWVTALSSADAQMAPRAATLARSLGSPRSCLVSPTAAMREAERLGAHGTALLEQLGQARVALDLGRYEESLEKSRTALDAAVHAPLLAAAAEELAGRALQRLGRPQDAAAHLQKAVKLGEAANDFLLAARSAMGLSSVVGIDQRQRDAGLEWMARGKALLQRAGGDALVEASLLHNEAVLELDGGDAKKAIAILERALALKEQLLGLEDVSTANTVGMLSMAHLKRKQFPEAIAYQRRALSITEKRRGPSHADTALQLSNLASTLLAAGRYDEALEHTERALGIQEKALGASHPSVAHSLCAQGAVRVFRGDLDGARAAVSRALAIREETLRAGHPDIGVALEQLGVIESRRGALVAARQHLERAVSVLSAAHGDAHRSLRRPLTFLANVARAEGKLDEALRLGQRALAVSEHAIGEGSPDSAMALLSLGQTYLAMRRPRLALAHLERANAIQPAWSGHVENLADLRFALARAMDASRVAPRRAVQLAREARAVYAEARIPASDARVVPIVRWLERRGAL